MHCAGLVIRSISEQVSLLTQLHQVVAATVEDMGTLSPGVLGEYTNTHGMDLTQIATQPTISYMPQI